MAKLQAPDGATMRMSPSIYMSYKYGVKNKSERAINQALAGVMGIKTEQTPEMRAGTEWHEKWEDETIQTGLPPAIFKQTAEVVATELKSECKLNDWLVIVGRADLLTPDSVVDYKTTSNVKKEAKSYLYTGQLAIYAYIFGVYQGEIWLYNLETKKVDTAKRHFSSAQIELVIKDVIKCSKEMKTMLIKMNEPWWREE